MFQDRNDGGKKLAAALSEYKGSDAVVLAVPRGGVVLGYEVAKALGLPLDIVPVRKIGHPHFPEFAIGAVDDHGRTIFNEEQVVGIDRKWLTDETEREHAEAKRRAATYRGDRPALDLGGKTALLVDDGIATGLSIRLAIKAARENGAKRIVVAVPVAPEEAVNELKQMGVEVMLLEKPADYLGAVGSHYTYFDQASDETVVRLLRQSR
ncbi:MAG: phosphoribosyl transferase [Candidatus Kaiserbacteria bacterium]|nr:MAG: phosphoribosyl transferase [Candidatus Kaiserbacteria bacterium]